MNVKVYYHHTDCGGVVYYAAYLEFLEEARTEFFAERGISIKDLILRERFFVVAHQEVDYRAPAAYGDTLQISTRLKSSSAVRVNLEHLVLRGDQTVVIEARTMLAFVDATFRPRPLPEDIINKIKQ